MKLILPLINKLKRKRLLINRASESYKKASHIGILYSYIDENKQRAINEFVEKLKKDGKKVDLLPSIKNKNADNRYFKTFRLEEVNSLGKWSNNHVNLFEMILKSELEYDIDYRMNKLYKYLKKLK